MDKIQDLFKNQWEKVLLGGTILLCLLSVGWDFVFPPEATQTSQKILDKLNDATQRIQQSKPPVEPVPDYGRIIEEPYKNDLVAKPLEKWAFYRRPYLWLTEYSGPVVERKTPRFNAPDKPSLALETGGIHLKWKQSGQNEFCVVVKTEVYRKIQGRNFEMIGTVAGETVEFTDSNVASRMKYTYYVKSYAKKDPNQNDLNPLPTNQDTQESEAETITTLPDIILDIQVGGYEYGEIIYNFVKDASQWIEPQSGYKCTNGKEIKRITWDKGRQGKKASLRFSIWKLDQANKKFMEFGNDYKQRIEEGDPIVVVKKDWKTGGMVFVDSGYKLIRLGKGHYEKTLGSNVRCDETPIVFMIQKSVNHHFTDMALTPFGLQGEDDPIKSAFAIGDGKIEKQQASDQLGGGGSSSSNGGGTKKPKKTGGSSGGTKKPTKPKKTGGSGLFGG